MLYNAWRCESKHKVLDQKFATKITTHIANKNDVFKVRKMNYNMAIKVTYNANICVEVENKEVQLQRKVPARPSQLRLKIEHYYEEKLPMYEESQKNYSKFTTILPQDSERQ